jgi:hypothetical protein
VRYLCGGSRGFLDFVFQRDNAFVEAAFERLIDIASRRVKAAAPPRVEQA